MQRGEDTKIELYIEVIKFREFFNSSKFDESIENNKMVDFSVWDPMGTQYNYKKDYKKFTSFWRMFGFKTVARYYLGLIILGMLVMLFAWLRIF